MEIRFVSIREYQKIHDYLGHNQGFCIHCHSAREKRGFIACFHLSHFNSSVDNFTASDIRNDMLYQIFMDSKKHRQVADRREKINRFYHQGEDILKQ